MKKTLALTLHFLLVFLIANFTSFGGSKTELNTVSLFDKNVQISKGDYLLISNPSHKPLADVWRYKYVYKDFWEEAPFRSTTVSGMGTMMCSVESIFKIEGIDDVFAKLRNEHSGGTFYIDLNEALLSREVDLLKNVLVNKFDLYISYLKTLPAIDEQTGLGYIETFVPLPATLNEFQKRKLITEAIAYIDTLKLRSVPKTSKYITAVSVDKYDFTATAFKTNKMPDMVIYDARLQDNIRKLIVNFSNLTSKFDLSVPETEAEKAVSNYMDGEDRKLYCIYNLEYTDVQNTKGNTRGYENRSINEFVQNAKVKSIDVYADRNFTVKISTINLN